MWSSSVIEELSNEYARKAARQHKTPYVPYNPQEIDTYPPFPFPCIGNYDPPGWTETERVFVDALQINPNDAGGPALSQVQFKAWLRKLTTEAPGTGFAVVEQGQFQVYVAAFARVP